MNIILGSFHVLSCIFQTLLAYRGLCMTKFIKGSIIHHARGSPWFDNMEIRMNIPGTTFWGRHCSAVETATIAIAQRKTNVTYHPRTRPYRSPVKMSIALTTAALAEILVDIALRQHHTIDLRDLRRLQLSSSRVRRS